VTESGSFHKVLQRRDVLALSFGAMIGWSWVAMSGEWVLRGGVLGALIAFSLGGIAMIFIALTYAELASAMPQAGGEHVYSARALGRTWSFVCTWAIIYAYVSVSAFEAVALPTVAEHFFPALNTGRLWTVAGWDVHGGWIGLGVLGATGMTWLNYIGLRPAAIFQTIASLLIVAAGVLLFSGATLSGELANAQPLFRDGVAGTLLVLVMVPAMLVGFDVIPQSAEEINLPRRELGKVLMFSVILAVLWYIGIVWAVAVAVPNAQLGGGELGSVQASSALWRSPLAGDLLILGGLAGILTSWNAFLVGGSRAVYALSRSGQLPAFLSRLHPRYGTPGNAIIMLGALSMISPFFGRPAMVWIVDASSFMVVIAYAIVAASFLVLRSREPEMERPYRAPFGKWVGWAALLSSLAILCVYLPGSPSALLWPQEWLMVALWSLLGLAFFLKYR
jgi:APA family basic amino acid/polyamine antiporter